MKVEVEKVIFNKKCTPVAVNAGSPSIFPTNADFRVFKDDSDRKIVAAHTERVLYVGGINKDEHLNHFLVIRNKKTNKVRLIHYDEVDMTSCTKTTASAANKIHKSTASTRNELTKQFGSNRAARAAEQQERMNNRDINGIKETLEEAVSGMKTEEGLLNKSMNQSIADTTLDYLPIINREATRIQEVYELENLIPSAVINGLQSDVNTILEHDDISELPLCNFCMQHIRLLKGNNEIESNSVKCKIYLYLNYLLKFLVTPVRSMNKKYAICESSSAVNSHILNSFSGQGANSFRTRSASLKDKLICNILVLAMIASPNNQVDLEPLSKEMKLGINKLKEISRLLAFSTSGNKVILKLPLPAPISLAKRKKANKI